MNASRLDQRQSQDWWMCALAASGSTGGAGDVLQRVAPLGLMDMHCKEWFRNCSRICWRSWHACCGTAPMRVSMRLRVTESWARSSLGAWLEQISAELGDYMYVLDFA